MTLRAYRDFDPNDPDNYNPNQEYDTGNDAADFQGTFLDQNAYSYTNRGQPAVTPKNRMFIVAGVLGIIAIGFAAAFTFSSRSGGDLPVIVAEGTAYKTKPETPGGIDIPFQDKMVFNRLDPEGQPVQAERLLPPPEEPMTLALQPSQQVQSPPAPAAQLAVEEAAPTTSKNTKITIANKPVVEPAIAADKMEKIAPTKGAIPAPINDEPVVVVTKTPMPKTAPAPVATAPTVQKSGQTATLEPVEGTYGESKVAAATPSVAKPSAPVAAAPVAAEKPAPAAAGGARIQLGSLPEKAAADRAVAKFSKDYAGVLGGAQLTLVKAEIPGKGTFWRVQSQPIDKAAADKICGAIKAKGGACLLAK